MELSNSMKIFLASMVGSLVVAAGTSTLNTWAIKKRIKKSVDGAIDRLKETPNQGA